MEKTKKHKFMRIRKVSADFYEIFRNYKAECIICVLGFIITCGFFRFVDGISIQSWALETADALFRGGFGKFNKILAQNLWNAPHGVANGAFMISNLLYAVWNLPVLLCHYIFKTDYTISFAACMWGKLFFVLLVIALGYVAYKIVIKITDDPKNGMLAAILIWGSVTIMASVGYAMQDEVVYMFFMFMGIYKAICGSRYKFMIWLIIACQICPLMILFAVPIVLYSSEKLRSIIWRMLMLLLVVAGGMGYINTLNNLSSEGEVDNVLGQTIFGTGLGGVSVFAAIVLFVYIKQWAVKHDDNKTKTLHFLWNLSVLSTAMCILGNVPHYRFMICTPFIVLSILTVKSKGTAVNGIFALCLFDIFRMWIMASTKSFLRMYAFNDFVKDLFAVDEYPHEKLTTILNIIFPSQSNSFPIICGLTVACAIWLLYLCYPNRKSKIACPIPTRVLSISWCSVQIVLVLLVSVFLMKVNIMNLQLKVDVHDAANAEITSAIDGKNYLEEYYCGKSASKVSVSVIPCTAGKPYPENQKLNLDIIEVSTDKTIGSVSYDASLIKSGKTITFKVDNINLKKGEWYKFRFYCPEKIEDKKLYIWFFRSVDGSADPERHYAVDPKETDDSDFDIISQIITF